MSQDSNTENSSNGKKRLSLKRKGASGEPTPPSEAPKQENNPPPAAAEPKTNKMSLKSKTESGKTSPPKEAPTPPAAAPASPIATPPAPSSAPPFSAAPPPPSVAPASEKTAESNTKPAAVDQVATGTPDAVTPTTEPKKVPIKIAEGDIVETAAPFQKEPEKPVKKGPKPPPGVKIVKDDDVPEKKKKAETRPPMLPPKLDTAETDLPAMPQSAADIDDDLEDTTSKAPKMGKSIALMLLVFLIIIGGVGALIVGGLRLMEDQIENAEVGPAGALPEDNNPVLKKSNMAADNPNDSHGAMPTPPQDTITAENTITAQPIESISTEEDAPTPIPTATPQPINTAQKKENEKVTAWVENMRPNAIMGNRMAINDKRYNVGDTVEESLGIEWVGHDPDLLVLTFRDANGVLYEKDY